MEIDAIDPQLGTVLEKVLANERLSRADGLALERSTDHYALLKLADLVARRIHGSRATYIINAHLDYTNTCVSSCKFCAFGKPPGSDNCYILHPSEAPSHVPAGVDEIHVVGGVNPSLRLKYFVELVSNLHRAFPKATIKAFTAVEIHALAVRENLSCHELLTELKEAGLGMVPGGGAEIFAGHVRKAVCPNKASAEEWLRVHRTAHELGIPSNSTMLYGHIENPEDRIDHLLRLRALQDQTHGFVAHVPLRYLPTAKTRVKPASPLDGMMDLRQTAIARLMLDNFPAVKAYWRAIGPRLAQAALRAGANDIDGTIVSERIMTESGSDAPPALNEQNLRELIEHAGLKPVRRDSFHNVMEAAD